jgi:hypothetical protein
VVPGDPGSTSAEAAAASAAPKYALQSADDSDANIATAGYVKGAYNAAIKGINYVQSEFVAASSALATANSALSAVQQDLESNYATQTGVVATVGTATTSGSFSGATVSGTFSSAAINGTVTGSATGTIPAMTTWGSTSVGSAPATAALSGTSISGNASGSMTGTASGTTSGSVSVASYLAS